MSGPVPFPRAAVLAACLACGAPAAAQTPEDFAASNLIAIFYHELGHALIDVMRLPIFGQEEDAADVLSILMIDEIFEEESAVEIARDAAIGFLSDTDADIALWDVHGPDLQRFFTLVCLFYGANPDGRAGVAQDLGLPAGRAEGCEEEYTLAIDSWGPVLDELYDARSGYRLRLVDGTDPRDPWADLTLDVIGEEVDALNADIRLPERIDVVVTWCDTVNAFYDPEARTIVMCTDLAAYFVARHGE